MLYKCVRIHRFAFTVTFSVIGLTILPWYARSEGEASVSSQAAIQGEQRQAAPQGAKPADFQSAIQHIVLIVRENRTFDQMFGTFPGANGATSGTISTGQVLPLRQTPDRVPRDMGHAFWDATNGIDYGRMDGFDLISEAGGRCNTNGDYLCMTQQTPVFQTTSPTQQLSHSPTTCFRPSKGRAFRITYTRLRRRAEAR